MKKLKGINLAILTLSSILLLLVGVVFIQISSNKIVKNTYINGIDVSGLTKNEAKEKIERSFKLDSIKIKYKDSLWQIDSSEVDLEYDFEQSASNAYNINRKDGFIKNLITTVRSYLGNNNKVDLVVSLNEDKIKSKLEEISKDINEEMVNASIKINGGKIVINEEVSGLELDIDTTFKHLKKSIQEGLQEHTLTVIKIEPEVKAEDLQDVNALLGSFSTRLSDSSAGRVSNIKLAAEKISGALLMPGDEFSYNKYTGKRTSDNGYKDATVIMNGEAVQGVGGGVCQVSTTLYNAVLYAGLDIVKVTNHSIPPSYVDKGRDATVSDGGLDFIFKNNYDMPVYVQSYYSNGTVTCQIYGNIKYKQNIKIKTNIDKEGTIEEIRENDPTLSEGTQKIVERGRKSYTVSTYRVYYDVNGNEIKREKIATSYYPSKKQLVAVGTKVEVAINEDRNNSSISMDNNLPNDIPTNDTPSNDLTEGNESVSQEVIN